MFLLYRIIYSQQYRYEPHMNEKYLYSEQRNPEIILFYKLRTYSCLIYEQITYDSGVYDLIQRGPISRYSEVGSKIQPTKRKWILEIHVGSLSDKGLNLQLKKLYLLSETKICNVYEEN